MSPFSLLAAWIGPYFLAVNSPFTPHPVCPLPHSLTLPVATHARGARPSSPCWPRRKCLRLHTCSSPADSLHFGSFPHSTQTLPARATDAPAPSPSSGASLGRPADLTLMLATSSVHTLDTRLCNTAPAGFLLPPGLFPSLLARLPLLCLGVRCPTRMPTGSCLRVHSPAFKMVHTVTDPKCMCLECSCLLAPDS